MLPGLTYFGFVASCLRGPVLLILKLRKIHFQQLRCSDPSMAIKSILFVCLGNICRSPAGENVMRNLLEQAGLANVVSCDSAGVLGYHTGDAPDARMCAAGRRRGLPMTGVARQVHQSDFERFDLILAMDDSNYSALQRLADDQHRHKVQRFCEWCERFEVNEVPDPYYGGPEGFEHVLDLLEDGCNQLLQHIQQSR